MRDRTASSAAVAIRRKIRAVTPEVSLWHRTLTEIFDHPEPPHRTRWAAGDGTSVRQRKPLAGNRRPGALLVR